MDNLRQISIQSEYVRKAIHLGLLVLPIAALRIGKSNTLLVVGVMAAAGLLLDILRSLYPAIEGLVQRLAGSLMRGSEARKPGKIRLNGATVILLSFALLLLLFPLPVAVAAFSIFVIGDALAALVGRTFGKTKVFGERSKTLEGSAAFCLAAIPVALLFEEPQLLPLVVAVTVGSVAEAVSSDKWDNLIVPILCAAAIVGIQKIL